MIKNKNKWWVLFVTTTATTLFLLDSTILPVALPTIEKSLGFSSVGVLWVLNAYLLTLTACLLIGGKLCEIFGFRTIFNLGLFLFGVGAVVCGCAQTPQLLVMGRIVQGVGSAFAFPATAALLISVFPAHQKARALGIDTGIASLFMLVGPVLGGVFAQYLSWRYIFWFYLPFVVFGLVMSYVVLRKSEYKASPFPVFSTLLMMGGVIAFVTGLMEGNSLGWSSSWIIVLSVVGPIFMLMFVVASLASSSPLVDFTLFKRPLFLGASFARFFAYFLVTVSVLWILYFQNVLGYSPAEIGSFIVVASLPVILMAPISGYIADRMWYRFPLAFGFFLLMGGFLWVAAFAHTHNLWIYFPGLCAFGLGLPFVMTPTLALGLSSIEDENLGTAAGLMMSIRQLATTLGIALMTALYYSVQRLYNSPDTAFIFVTLFSLGLTVISLIIVLSLVRRKYESIALPQDI